MIRLGLCCTFRTQPFRFRAATWRHLSGLPAEARAARLASLNMENARTLLGALAWCADHGIGSFRISSQVLPLKTHPQGRYDLLDLPGGDEILATFNAAGVLAAERGLRLTLHPDQFVVPGSPRPEVARSSLEELSAQGELAAMTGADVITIHGGGAYGHKETALARTAESLGRVASPARERLGLENDERTYTPRDLLPFCREHGLPFVYDVHHHRCLPDGLSEEEVTAAALQTWDREPVFHVSSPINGWGGPTPSRHHDFIDPADFPESWLDLDATVEVEAKAKEEAVLRLRHHLVGFLGPGRVWPG